MRMLSTAALAVLAAPFAPLAGEAAAQAPFADSEEESAYGITISVQLSVLFQRPGDADVSVVRTSFSDRAYGPDASEARVIASLERASAEAVARTVAAGAACARIDAVAVVYAFGDPRVREVAFAPLGMFVDTTDLTRDSEGQPILSRRLRFIPEPSQASLALAPER